MAHLLERSIDPCALARKREFDEARRLTDGLFSQVRPEAWCDRPIPERHRIIFYLGHLEAFDWNLLGKRALGLGPISPELDALFAFGIDPPIGQLPQDEPHDWPSLGQTREYVTCVREKLDRVLPEAPIHAVEMAIEHRLMHAETFTYMLHNLPYERRFVSPVKRPQSLPSPPLEMKHVTAGIVTLGKSREDGFGWDNEFEQHQASVAGFAMSKHKITNGQYLEFVNAGGTQPQYWLNCGGEWLYRGFAAEVPLPLDHPVYVTQLQAQAYATWVGRSLPTEAQFHRAAFGHAVRPTDRAGNFDFRHTDAISVAADAAHDNPFGIEQLVGNGWEWTSTVFAPLAGFAASPDYPGYSANFFDGEHFVLKGASCATQSRLVRPSFRNWFRRDYPYAYTTFRVMDN
jgi:formylglycine-generating enzyme required for sulfatase activity